MQALAITSNVDGTLSQGAKDRLARLEAWDLTSVTRRTQRRLGWSRSKRRIAEREYRKFIGLIAINPSKPYGMAGEVDELWHDHVLNTQDYAAMCRDVVGAFVHHCPSDDRRKSGLDGVVSAYNGSTRPDLQATYAGPVSRIWPKDAAADAVAKCCNHISEIPTG